MIALLVMGSIKREEASSSIDLETDHHSNSKPPLQYISVSPRTTNHTFHTRFSPKPQTCSSLSSPFSPPCWLSAQPSPVRLAPPHNNPASALTHPQSPTTPATTMPPGPSPPSPAP